MSKRNLTKGLGAIFVIVMLSAIVMVPSAALSAPPGPGGTDQDSLVTAPAIATAAQAQAAVAYWTAERMAAAKPYPMPVLTAKGSAKPAITGSAATGPAGTVKGFAPGAKPNTTPTLVSALLPMAWTRAYYSYPFPYDRSSVPPATSPTYPWQTIGKVFFTQNGVNYVCSGTSTTSSTGRLVMTAGHCVNAGGNGSVYGSWSTNVVFCPAWYYGPQKGCWGAYDLWTFTGWSLSGNLRRDVGAIVTADTPYVGGRMQDVIGAQGFAWNWGPQSGYSPQLWWEMGYPQASPFNGQQMITCQSSLAVTDAPNSQSGPDTNGVGCDMTGGSSGGGWIWQFKMGGSGYLNGHNDYTYISPSQPEGMYSPYYDTTVYNLWNAAQQEYP
jgi:hypothetical protein